MKYLIILGLILSSQVAFSGPRVVKNGGDIYAIEFLGIGQQVLKALQDQNLKTKIDLKKLAMALDETTVESVSTPLMLGSAVKDAINYPQTKRIVFNRLSWAGKNELSLKAILVLHEYLGVAEINDAKYATSTALVNEVGYGKVTYEGQVFDRKVSKKEMQKILPVYLNFISSRVKKVPSPQDYSALKQISILAAAPSSSTGRGSEVYSIDTIKKGIENHLQDLNGITEDERVQSSTRLIDGFRSSSGEVICELGYSSVSRHKDTRIVRCVDNRSQAPASNEDEGYTDERTFILSIDEKTLAPLGVLSLKVFQAG